MKTVLDYEIRKALEEAYRRGYSHGFNFGMSAKPSEFNKIEKEILEWRRDLFITKGAPGSTFEKVDLKWFSEDEDGHQKDKSQIFNEKFVEDFINEKWMEHKEKNDGTPFLPFKK